MEFVKNLAEYQSERPCVVTLGKFDGVHRGHRKLLKEVRRIALENHWKAGVFTFTVSPQVQMGRREAKMLMTNEERENLLRDLGVDLLVECPFTEEIRSMEPDQFIREVLLKRLHASAVVAGTDFRFGKDRKGDADYLLEAGKSMGFHVSVMQKEMDGEREISSTYIREELEKGHMEKVQELMGGPYFITGPIIHGRHLGHSLGFPTINQRPAPEKMLPPRGVYFSRTYVGGKVYQGISSLGVKPTVNSGNEEGNETYLFDCSLDLYGQEAKVEFLSFRRPEEKFDSLDALKNQMSLDIESADQFFSSSRFNTSS